MHTPTQRGFSSWLGYYQADEDYFNHTHGYTGKQQKYCPKEEGPVAAIELGELAACPANVTRKVGRKIAGNKLGKEVTGGTDASCCALCVANLHCVLYSYTDAKGTNPSKCWLHDGDSSGYKPTAKVTTTRVRTGGGAGPTPSPPSPPSPSPPRPRNWKPYDLSLGNSLHTTPRPAGAAGYDGTYSASLYGPRAVELIQRHDWQRGSSADPERGGQGPPLYVYLAMQVRAAACHTSCASRN